MYFRLGKYILDECWELNPALMVGESSSFPLGMKIARTNRWEKMTPLGNKLGDYSVGSDYSSGLAEEQYSVGREVLC